MAIYKRGNVWWMDVYVGSERRRVRKSTGCTDKVQARLVEQAAIAVNRGITNRQRAMAIVDAVLPLEQRAIDISEMHSWYRATAQAEGAIASKNEWQRRLSVLSTLEKWLKVNTRVKWVSDVDAETAWQFSKYLGSSGCAAKTLNNRIGLLRTIWVTFIKLGKAKENPWEHARVRRRPDEETHGRAFSTEEIERILEASRAIGCEWEGVVTVALYTGIRKRDIECLKWESVDLARRVIHLKPNKTAKHGIVVHIPMHDKVYKTLSNIPQDGEYVFPWRQSHPNGQRPKKGDHFFCEVLERANITAKEGETITFHCLRHTFVSRLAEAGVAQDVRMRLAGHTNAATHDLYTHDDVSGRKAIDLLD